MLKHLILVMALVVPLVALSFPVGGVGLLDSLGSLLFNRLTSEKSTTKSNTSAQQVLSSLSTLPVTPGHVAASLHLKHNRPRHPKLLARRSAQEVDYGNDGADVDGQEDLRFGELPENRDYFPQPEDSDVYPPQIDDEQEQQDRDPELERAGPDDDQQEEPYLDGYPLDSRPYYPGRSQQQFDYQGRQEPADFGGRSPFDPYRAQFDDDRQQVEPLSSESDPQTEEAPEDPDNDDQDGPNYNINRDGDISDDGQEDDAEVANSQPGDVDYDYKKAAKRFKRTPNKAKQLKLVKALRKGRHAKKQRGNAKH